MTSNPHNYLLVVSDREALGWVLREQRMAFRPGRRAARDAAGLSMDDALLIYTTRGCFHNPSRDRGRVIGRATVTSAVSTLDPPIRIGTTSFATGCSLRLEDLAPFGDGVDLASMVSQLSFPSAWATYLRRTLVPLDTADAATLRTAVAKAAVRLQEALPSYLDRATPVRNRTYARS